MADVFISYAREDKARAEQVARGLEGMGLDVFWDSEIPPGQTWADYIEGKLSQCKAVIVLWSANSTKSQWVREEARMGRDKGTLIPAMLDTSQAPFGFGEVQAANLAAWNGQQDHPDWRRFSEAVRAAIGRPAPAAAPVSHRPQPAAGAGWQQSQTSSSSGAKKGVPVWVWIVGGIVAVLGVLYVIGSMNPTPPPMTAENPVPAVSDPSQQPVAQQPAAPTVDGDAQQIILAQLQQAQAVFTQQGFQQLGTPVSGGLSQGQTWNVPIQLYGGYDYRVIGVCDRDCNDLDLVLYDSNGAIIVQDTSTDDHPVLSVQPGANGNFTVQVQMYHCSVAPCYYALTLFGRGG